MFRSPVKKDGTMDSRLRGNDGFQRIPPVSSFPRRRESTVPSQPRVFHRDITKYLGVLGAFMAFLTVPVWAETAVYPDDSYSSPPVEERRCFDHLDGIQIVPGLIARTQGFHHDRIEMVAVEGGTATRWRFNRKQGVNEPTALGLGTWIRRAPEAVSFWIENHSQQPFTVSLLSDEISWQPGTENRGITWIIGPGKPVEPGYKGVLSFPWTEAVPAKPVDGRRISYPLGNLTVVLQGIQDETDYEVVLDNLTISSSLAMGIKVTRFEIPEKSKVGEPLPITLSATGEIQDRTLDLEFLQGRTVAWRLRLQPEEREALAREKSVNLSRSIPWYLPPGDYTIVAVAGGYRIPGSTATLALANPDQPGLPKAERRLAGGRPSLFVEGKPFTWNGYASYDFQPGNVNDFGAQDATVFCVPANAGRHVHPNVSGPILQPDGTYDFSEFDQKVLQSLAANPEAFLVPRVSLSLPDFWIAEHGGVALVRTGQGDLEWEETGRRQISLTAEGWREAQTGGLIQLIDHCRKQPWAKRVIGFIEAGEVTEEWFAWACNDGFYSDYSQSNQAGFVEWLKEAGRQPVPIPNPKDRQRPGFDLYPGDAQGKAASAYAQYSSSKTAETIRYFAEVIKRETGGKSLAGCFYGYVVQLAGEPRQHLSGNFDLRAILDDPNIDFLAGIPLHNFRDFLDGYNPYISATESILAAGKLYLNENDLFSFLHPLVWYREYDITNPRRGTLFMHRRELATDMIHGTQRQWFSLMTSWHHDAGLMKELGRQIQLRNSLPSYDITGTEQVAVVVDDKSFAWYPPETKQPSNWIPSLMRSVAHTGAPLGVWLLSDIDKLPERIKVVVVSGCAAPDSKDLAKLKTAIQAGGRSFMLVGPVGLIDPVKGEWDIQRTAELSGLAVQIESGTHSSRFSLPDGTALGDSAALQPRLFVANGALASYSDGKGATASRSLTGGGTLLWTGVPPSNETWLRTWLAQAGVHLYAPEGFFVHASHDLVSVTSPLQGKTELVWPEEVTVKDLFEDWSGQGQKMICPFEAGQTRLFRVERKGR